MHLRLSAIALIAATSAYAQTPAPTPPMDSVPEKLAPDAKPTGPNENLSRKLDQSGGVIKPKEVDPGIEKSAPNASDPSVIPPPGTGGGGPAPEAK